MIDTVGWFGGNRTLTVFTSQVLPRPNGRNLFITLDAKTDPAEVQLTDARKHTVGWRKYVLYNESLTWEMDLLDATGTIIARIDAGLIAFVHLADNSTEAGTWIVDIRVPNVAIPELARQALTMGGQSGGTSAAMYVYDFPTDAWMAGADTNQTNPFDEGQLAGKGPRGYIHTRNAPEHLEYEWDATTILTAAADPPRFGAYVNSFGRLILYGTDVDEYTDTTDSWALLNPPGNSAGAYSAAASGSAASPDNITSKHTTSGSSNHRHDVNADTYTAIPDRPNNGWFQTGRASLDDEDSTISVTGGNALGGGSSPRNDCDRFSLLSGTWTGRTVCPDTGNDQGATRHGTDGDRIFYGAGDWDTVAEGTTYTYDNTLDTHTAEALLNITASDHSGGTGTIRRDEQTSKWATVSNTGAF